MARRVVSIAQALARSIPGALQSGSLVVLEPLVPFIVRGFLLGPTSNKEVIEVDSISQPLFLPYPEAFRKHGSFPIIFASSVRAYVPGRPPLQRSMTGSAGECAAIILRYVMEHGMLDALQRVTTLEEWLAPYLAKSRGDLELGAHRMMFIAMGLLLAGHDKELALHLIRKAEEEFRRLPLAVHYELPLCQEIVALAAEGPEALYSFAREAERTNLADVVPGVPQVPEPASRIGIAG